MDEVDGMSAGDRGGVGALNALIKKTKVFRLLVKSRMMPLIQEILLDSYHLHLQRSESSENEALSTYYIQPVISKVSEDIIRLLPHLILAQARASCDSVANHDHCLQVSVFFSIMRV